VLLLCEENKPRTMTHQNHQTNGASLEDCHTNFYALVSTVLIFWAIVSYFSQWALFFFAAVSRSVMMIQEGLFSRGLIGLRGCVTHSETTIYITDHGIILFPTPLSLVISHSYRLVAEM